MAKRKETKTLQSRKTQESLLAKMSTEDIVLMHANRFYFYFDVVKGITPDMTLSDVRTAYKEMCAIQKAYPRNAVLANKLDEAAKYL